MTTAIIGAGKIGGRVATLLARGGQDVLVADRDDKKSKALAHEIGRHAKATGIKDAMTKADVVVLAVSYDAIKDVIAQNADALGSKIVVDPSNAIAPDGKGGFVKQLPAEQSAGQVNAALMPSGARLVKAFGSLRAETLTKGANRKPEKAVMFYAADDASAGDAVADLIKAAGYEPMSIGSVDKSSRIEVAGDLHEMGKLGKLVSHDEAKAALAKS